MDEAIGSRAVRRYSLLFLCVYMVSYVTRISFSAIISEMAAAAGWRASLLAYFVIALVGALITVLCIRPFRRCEREL